MKHSNRYSREPWLVDLTSPANWCVTHMAGTIVDRLSTGPSRPLDARAQAFAECFARVYDYL